MSWSRFIPGFDPVSLYLPSSSITFQPPNSHDAVAKNKSRRSFALTAQDSMLANACIQPPDEARGDTAPALPADIWVDVACVVIWLAAVAFWIVRWAG